MLAKSVHNFLSYFANKQMDIWNSSKNITSLVGVFTMAFNCCTVNYCIVAPTEQTVNQIDLTRQWEEIKKIQVLLLN